MGPDALTLTRTFHFSAGHRLANPALGEAENRALYGPCFRPHGHNYLLEVSVGGRVDPRTGMAADLEALESAVRRAVLDLVDHRDLNADVPALGGIITTGENLARQFWRLLSPALPPGSLRRVAVVETANNTFEYYGEADDGDTQ
ncbi:MAG: 6-carboxytetrahydropterin synthase [Candidatus Rokubacteria bacterium]|nr:6-carboxytetrahydropterin synthase [Candidatus Rokubacteria bacterium]MBI2554171.1 6-carboxytetrahydropterin synthase [Candidatus Rokubacteria bacterium]